MSSFWQTAYDGAASIGVFSAYVDLVIAGIIALCVIGFGVYLYRGGVYSREKKTVAPEKRGGVLALTLLGALLVAGLAVLNLWATRRYKMWAAVGGASTAADGVSSLVGGLW